MNTQEVERAAQKRKFYDALSGGHGMFTADYVFDILFAAGLLRTEADRLAEALHGPLAETRYYGDGPWLSSSNGYTTIRFKTNDAAQRFHSALSALALHVRPKPVERWTLEWDRCAWVAACPSVGTKTFFACDAEPEARAYVARKNAEERAK